MTADRRIHVAAAPATATGVGHSFGPDDLYAHLVWLPAMGPTSFVLWQRLARLLPMRLAPPCVQLRISWY